MSSKRRGVELLKSLLILLLSASALYLLTMTPLVQDSGILNLLRQDQTEQWNGAHVTFSAAAAPSRMAVHNGTARYGVQYDQDQVDEMFLRFGPLLGEALDSADPSELISERRWQEYLQSPGVYFDFTGDIPLSALGSWLKQDGSCALNASARRILLVNGGDDRVLLCYQDADGDGFRASSTDLDWKLHLESAITGVAGSDAYFGFEVEAVRELLCPYTLITEEHDRQIYSAATPIVPGGDQSSLLDALDYTGRNHALVSGGELYLDGNDRLRILTGGQVVYDAAAAGKYPVAVDGAEMTVAEAIETARRMAESTIGAHCGGAELYLMSAAETDRGWQIRFGYRLDGSLVWLYDEGWAAEFYVRENCVMEFTLWFRSYQNSGTQALLLSAEQTALMVPSLTEGRRELTIQYWDQGEDTVAPAWVAR